MKTTYRVRLGVDALLSALLVSCSCSTPRYDVLHLTGCYAFKAPLFQWFVMAPGGYQTHVHSTNVLYLKTTPARRQFQLPPRNEGPLEVVAPALRDTAQATRHAFVSFWAFLPPDSVHLIWSEGHRGWVLSLVVRGDSFHGTAEEITDLLGVQPRRVDSLDAVRVPCSVQPGP
jgi:hypothetical protein